MSRTIAELEVSSTISSIFRRRSSDDKLKSKSNSHCSCGGQERPAVFFGNRKACRLSHRHVTGWMTAVTTPLFQSPPAQRPSHLYLWESPQVPLDYPAGAVQSYAKNTWASPIRTSTCGNSYCSLRFTHELVGIPTAHTSHMYGYLWENSHCSTRFPHVLVGFYCSKFSVFTRTNNIQSSCGKFPLFHYTKYVTL